MSWSPDPRALGSYRRRGLVPYLWRIPVLVVLAVVFVAATVVAVADTSGEVHAGPPLIAALAVLLAVLVLMWPHIRSNRRAP